MKWRPHVDHEQKTEPCGVMRLARDLTPNAPLQKRTCIGCDKSFSLDFLPSDLIAAHAPISPDDRAYNS
jgi:hypothetical protein